MSYVEPILSGKLLDVNVVYFQAKPSLINIRKAFTRARRGGENCKCDAQSILAGLFVSSHL